MIDLAKDKSYSIYFNMKVRYIRAVELAAAGDTELVFVKES